MNGENIEMIDWPPFPLEVGMLDHPATEADLAAGRAGFAIRDSAGVPHGTPVPMGMTRLGFLDREGDRVLGVAVQVESDGTICAVSVRHDDGSFSVGTLAEFKAAPRCLILFEKPGYTLDQAEQEWSSNRSKRFEMARRGNVLALRWGNGPVLFVRYANGDVVKQEIALIDHPRRPEVERCTSLFEVSFLDLEETLDEINSLIDVQCTLQQATEGFLYLEWNGHLSANGE